MPLNFLSFRFFLSIFQTIRLFHWIFEFFFTSLQSPQIYIRTHYIFFSVGVSNITLLTSFFLSLPLPPIPLPFLLPALSPIFSLSHHQPSIPSLIFFLPRSYPQHPRWINHIFSNLTIIILLYLKIVNPILFRLVKNQLKSVNAIQSFVLVLSHALFWWLSKPHYLAV